MPRQTIWFTHEAWAAILEHQAQEQGRGRDVTLSAAVCELVLRARTPTTRGVVLHGR